MHKIDLNEPINHEAELGLEMVSKIEEAMNCPAIDKAEMKRQIAQAIKEYKEAE